MNHRLLLSLCLAACHSACHSGGAPLLGLAVTPSEDAGPTIVWDLEARPLPEIPFPNDVATRSDLGSPTGRRLNVALGAVTQHEAKLRRLIDTLDGFGTYAPMWVRFDGRVDVADLFARQNDADANNDALYVLNVDPRSPSFGERVAIDVGGGRFPLTLERSDRYFAADPRVAASNLVLETVGESDADGDGLLDPLEDTDDDGVLDVPNLWSQVTGDAARSDPWRDLVSFYELETDTLMWRPVLPLAERTTYAVVLTRRLVGAGNGSPVRSPFAFVNHLQQSHALSPLVEDGLLSGLGLSVDEVAFAWSFTTQSVSEDLVLLRAGLYGSGPFMQLASAFPAVVTGVHAVEKPERGDNLHTLRSERLVEAFDDPGVREALGLSEQSTEVAKALYTENVSHLVFFELESPALLENDDGVFDLEPRLGRVAYERETVQVVCAVPRPRSGQAQPFPVAFYGHGYGSSRFETLGFAGSLARFGIATCGLDAYGHGIGVHILVEELIRATLAAVDLDAMVDAVFMGRARDLNHDDVADSGGDFWTANAFHTRDVVRQSVLDHLAAIRVLRAFGDGKLPVDVDGDGARELNGDFDADGVPDLGGETQYYFMGQSLGGFLSAVAGPVEPHLVATAPGSGGAGLTDVVVRTGLSDVVRAVYLPLMGPMIVGVESDDSTPEAPEIEISMLVADVTALETAHFATFPDAAHDALFTVGDRVRLEDLDNGERVEVTVHPTGNPGGGSFRLHFPADRGDRLRLSFFRAGSAEPYRVIETFERKLRYYGEEHAVGSPLVALQDGMGLRRGTPELRRLVGFAQMITDRADPASYMPFYKSPLAVPPEGERRTSLLVVNTIGDMWVPINAGVAVGRTAGLLEPFSAAHGKTLDRVLIDSWVLEGLEGLRRFEADPCHFAAGEFLFDPDEASFGADPVQGPRPSLVVRPPACDGTLLEPSYCAATCSAAPPVRATQELPDATLGLRLLYFDEDAGPMVGGHGFGVPDPTLPYDYSRYQINQIGRFFQTGGREIVDDPCLEDESCDFFAD